MARVWARLGVAQETRREVGVAVVVAAVAAAVTTRAKWAAPRTRARARRQEPLRVACGSAAAALRRCATPFPAVARRGETPS